MRINKLETFFNGSYFFSATAATLPQRLPYQVLVACCSQAANQIEQLILSQLQGVCEQGYHLQMTTRKHAPLIDLTLAMACTTAERAVLVRLVSRLGLENNVRSVCWRSVPQADK